MGNIEQMGGIVHPLVPDECFVEYLVAHLEEQFLAYPDEDLEEDLGEETEEDPEEGKCAGLPWGGN